jgi:hypothetical protein
VKNYKEYLVSSVTSIISFNEAKNSNMYFEEWMDALASHVKPTGGLHMLPVGQPQNTSFHVRRLYIHYNCHEF